MLLELFPEVDSVILDMDGVLWRGDLALGDLKRIIQRIGELHLKYILSTNNSTKTPEQYREKLASYGADVPVENIITSSNALAALLQGKHPAGGNVFVIGEDGLLQAMSEGGFSNSEQNALAVVAGLDRYLSYDKLQKATLLIRSGVPFYGTNPDKTYPAPQGLVPGAGAILSLLETASGVSPIVAGKPHRYLFDLALKLMDSKIDQTISIGDRLETDIQGATQIGCKTALVLSGVTSRNDLQAGGIQPDIIAQDLTELLF